MYFKRGSLHQAYQSIQRVDADEWLIVLVLRVNDGKDFTAHALPAVLLEKALLRRAARAADKGERARNDVRRHEAPDLFIIARKACLGDACVLPVDPVGVGERYLR